MARLLSVLLLAALTFVAGCAQNHFNLPQESVANKVRVLGIVPIITDPDSDIRHPQKDDLVALISAENRKNERELLRLVKNTNSFYTVTTLDLDPATTFRSLLFRRERRDDATIQYNKYFWKEDALADLMKKNSLDALMFVVVSGISRPDKITSSNFMDSLETEYNFLIMTAQIVDARGTLLWEYPNFRRQSLSFTPLMNLQYPAFDEAKANMSSKTNLKFKTIEGIKRALERKKSDLLGRNTPQSEIYATQFDEMTSLIEIDRSKSAPSSPEPQKYQALPPREPIKEVVPSSVKENVQ